MMLMAGEAGYMLGILKLRADGTQWLIPEMMHLLVPSVLLSQLYSPE